MQIRHVFFFLAITALLSPGLPAQVLKERNSLIAEGVPDIPQSLFKRLEQYQQIRSASFADWDGKGRGMFITTRFADVVQVHHVAKAGAMRRQITFGAEPTTGIRACPDSSRNCIIFSQDEGGIENYQLYLYDGNTDRVSLLTDGVSRHLSAQWNKSGTQIVFLNNSRNTVDMDLYIMDVFGDRTARRVAEFQGAGWSVSDWDESKNQLLMVRYLSINESSIHLLDLKSGKTTALTPEGERVRYGAPVFASGLNGIFYVSDKEGEYAELFHHDLQTGKAQVLSHHIPWDIEEIELSPDGKNLAFTANEDGYLSLYLMNTRNFSVRPCGALPEGLVTNMKFHPDSRRLALTINQTRDPADVFVLDIKTQKLSRWTHSETAGLHPEDFSGITVFYYPSFDSADGAPRKIPAFVYKPLNANGKLPVLIDIHGGPEGQSLPNFNISRQFWANDLGIAVVVPNVRGSLGYGKTYVQLDNGYLRENSVRDIGALLDWIQTQPDLDAERVAVYGASYGGYMSLATMTHYSDRLRCGIDLFGISDFVTFLERTSAYRRDLRRVEYGDERDPDMRAFMKKIAPLSNLDKITKPMFVFQGKNDPRVPLSESEQMVKALKDKGLPVWYVLALNEGHGIAKKTNRDFVYAAMALFLQTYLID